MKIIFLNSQSASITGGHKYNDAFMEYLSGYSGLKYLATPSCTASYIGWRKLLAPVIELKHLLIFKRGDLVFWGDTSFMYHFLLAVFTRYFKHLNSFVIVHH